MLSTRKCVFIKFQTECRCVGLQRFIVDYWAHSSWMATLKNDLSLHNLTFEDAIEMALDKPLWGLLAASGATH